MHSLKTRIIAWLESGTKNYNIHTRRRLVIINLMTSLVSAIALFYAVLFTFLDFSGLKWAIILMFVVGTLIGVTPKLHSQNPYFGSLYNLAIWLMFGITLIYLFGAGAGFHYFFLGGATSTILIFSIRKNLVSVISFAFQVFLFIFTEVSQPTHSHLLQVSDGLINALFFSNIMFLLLVQFCLIGYAFYIAHQAEAALEEEYRYSERLLANMMPSSIAAQLKREPQKTIANGHDQATILFADIVGFTERSSGRPPQQVVKFLNELFTSFDALAHEYGLEKIKTLGDAFMVAGGMPDEQPDHCERVADMALAMMEEVAQMPAALGAKIELRIGIHSGPVVAGVIGTKKPFYDVWGDTVNLAARLETTGETNRIQVTTSTKELLEDKFLFEHRGAVNIKGKGPTDVWYLISRK